MQVINIALRSEEAELKRKNALVEIQQKRNFMSSLERGQMRQDKLDLNSLFSTGLGDSRKRLISEVISLHVSLEALLDAFVSAKKIKPADTESFYAKATAVSSLRLRKSLFKINRIRNKCAHKRMDDQRVVRSVLKECESWIEHASALNNTKFSIARAHSPALRAAAIVVFDELASLYQVTTPRTTVLDGLYAPGQRTLDDEICDVIGTFPSLT